MVLDDVAERAGLLVVGAAPLHPEGLGDGDLDVVDVAPVPDRLEDAVGEAEDEDVLDRLLAQVVVDPEDLRFLEGRVQRGVELAGGGEIASKRLLDHHPAEATALFLAAHPLVLQPLCEWGEAARRDREVVDAVPRRPPLTVGGLQGPFDPVEAAVPVREGGVAQPLGEAAPHLLVHPQPGESRDGVAHVGAKLIIGQLAAGRTDHREMLGEEAVDGQRVEGGHQLALGQVAGRTEDHHRRGGRRRQARGLRHRLLGHRRIHGPEALACFFCHQPRSIMGGAAIRAPTTPRRGAVTGPGAPAGCPGCPRGGDGSPGGRGHAAIADRPPPGRA